METDGHPFLVRVQDKLAGFVLVNQFTHLPGSQYSIAKFFILRKYRQRGIGRQVTFHIFNLSRGRWEIHQVHTNIVAQQFWRHIIGAYTKGNYIETVMEDKIGRALFNVLTIQVSSDLNRIAVAKPYYASVGIDWQRWSLL